MSGKTRAHDEWDGGDMIYALRLRAEAARADRRDRMSELSAVSEKLLSDLDSGALGPDEYSEISARLWMVERSLPRAEVVPDPWERFRAALVEHQDWHARPVLVSGYVGVSADGDFFAGAHVDADWWTDDESEQVDGHSVEAAIDGQIDRMRRWRQDRDVERMEWAEEDAAGGTE